jgi:hypothetical protein
MWSKIFALVAFSIVFASCAPSVVVTCPPLREYDRAFMSRLADEMEAAAEDSAMVKAIIDYRMLRDVIRACKS